MRIRNKGTSVCFFPYAGANGARGRNLDPGGCSDELPIKLFENRYLKRHWEEGYIDVLLNPEESVAYSKQFTLSTIDEGNLDGYSVVCRPSTVKRPITPPPVKETPAPKPPDPAPKVEPKGPNTSKEGEVIDIQRVMVDPTRSPIGSPIDDIPTVMKAPPRIPVEKYQEPRKPVAPPPPPQDAVIETPAQSAVPDVAVAVAAHAEEPVAAPAPVAEVAKPKKAKKAKKTETTE
jgi:hypothetical protein